MKTISLYVIFCFIIAVSIIGCSPDNPASSGDVKYNPKIHKLEKIHLNDAETLVLSPADAQVSMNVKTTSLGSCDELGELKGAIYEKLEVESGEMMPCFKNIAFWKNGAIFGKYAPLDSMKDVWFISNINGDVFHLPGIPYKGQGFKNEKRIRFFAGKPVYLNESGQLIKFDLETGEEETIIDSPVWRYVILHRPDGEHIVYQDQHGAGKRLRPNEITEALGAINNASVFYENESGDLEYNKGMYLKRVVFSKEGEIVNDASTTVPVAYSEWVEAAIPGSTMPMGPVFSSSMESCEKLENIMICGEKGYVIAESSVDIREIDWCDFGHCSQLNAKACLESSILYFYSENETTPASRQLTRIENNLNSYFNVLNNVEINNLACYKDGGILVKGYNTDISSEESFHYKDAVKTMLTAPITDFIK